MSVLSALAARYTSLSPSEVEHLHRLLGEWQLLADLAFSDLLLFARVRDDERFVILGQVRPYPAQTLYPEDMVGGVIPVEDESKITRSFADNRVVREGDPEWREGVPIREEAIPVLLDGEPIAVISAEQNLATARTPSHLELSYLRAAADLEQMIAEGTFPFILEEEAERELSPRVGDGFLELDRDWIVRFASPNAVSAYRRLGTTANMLDRSIDETGIDHRHAIEAVARGRPIEDEVDAGGAVVIRRFIPVIHGGVQKGTIGLVRDITESRRRDRMLSIKDATIREIHHRVKNNLQTVASLLRLQARRLGTSEARAELEESVRRIASIALVHETLSHDSSGTVEFDAVARRVLEMVQDSLVRPDRPIAFSLNGSAGKLPSDIASPLSLIVMELIQNAVEHAFESRGGSVVVDMSRDETGVVVVVRDDGQGLPEGFSFDGGTSLGLQIVRTLATELSGEVRIESKDGTHAHVSIPVDRAY